MLLTWQEEASQCHAKWGALMQTVSPTDSHKSSQVPTAPSPSVFLPPGGAGRELLGTAS